MRERIERYARRLEGLSIQELSESAEKLVGFQRRNEAALIAHLAEISRRQGHLELGYRSLFDYSTRHLGLGRYSVWNRTQVAGVSRRFPQVLEYLADGKVSLSSLGVLAPHLTDENVERLLAEAVGKTKDEVKEIIVALSPKPAAEPMIRRQPVRRCEASRDEGSDGGGDSAPEASPRAETAETAEPPALPVSSRAEGAPRKPAGIEPARPEVYNFRFSAGKCLKEKLERLAEVLGIENSTGRMAEIIETALDLALEKKDPKRKLERRRKREAARAGPRPDEAAGERQCGKSPAGTRPDEAAAPRSGGVPPLPGSAGVSPASGDGVLSAEAVAGGVSQSPGRGDVPAPSPSREGVSATRHGRARSRHIPGVRRERAFERAAYQCEYVGPSGVRCTARSGLEIDHVRPYGKGGGSEEENLRVLCRAHNLFAAAREYGEEFMSAKTAAG